jgi:putative ABC transport system ATP-binding protein
MIEIQNLKFKYPSTETLILDIPNLKIEKGEKIFLFGPSGSGKTTFLEVLAGINLPQEGSLKIDGQNMAQMNSQQRDQFRSDHIGYIFQSFNLIPYLNVLENITLPLYLSHRRRQRISIDQEEAATREICKFLGIDSFLNRSVTELSIGQQQRVAAARAILGEPELLLADEPTSSLDYDHREKFIRLLFEVCQRTGTTVIFVSHDRSLEKLFDRSISLKEINHALTNSEEL